MKGDFVIEFDWEFVVKKVLLLLYLLSVYCYNVGIYVSLVVYYVWLFEFNSVLDIQCLICGNEMGGEWGNV